VARIRPIRVTLMSREHGPLRNAAGFLASVFLLPVALVVKLLIMPFERPARSSPAEVAACLRDFLNDSSDDRDWAWDDFTSVPLADARLESIRRRGCKIALPLTEEGRRAVELLLAEAESLIPAK
jgi:hypothetical protein